MLEKRPVTPADARASTSTTSVVARPSGAQQAPEKKRKRQGRNQDALAEVRATMEAQLDAIHMPLPSDFDLRIIRHRAMTAVVQDELHMREGCANDALDALRLHLTTHATLADRKKQASSGVKGNTKWDKRLSRKRAAILTAKTRYRQIRETMVRLGMAEDDVKFKPLLDTDVRPFVLITEEQRLGDSSRRPSWIWSDFSFIMKEDDRDVKDFLLDSGFDSQDAYDLQLTRMR